MEKTYNHKDLENEIYDIWETTGVFSPEKSIEYRKNLGLETLEEHFSILMPPPNANAPLHCGHATYSIQDLMARYKRMRGYKVCYFPGTDHAGFETQVVYERKLKKEGKSRFDFDRETLYNDILNFVKENSTVATNQLKKIGMSADWSRNTFMLDQFVLDTVFNTFKKMHDDGLVYRDNYMVNYSPYHGTTFSNLETEHIDQVTNLYYVKYSLKDGFGNITVCTTRPETIPADVAIAVNPSDERYKNYVGKTVLNPLNNREMPIIADDYVDMEFGTGALKITPAHDFNDYEIGKKHNLEAISIIDLYGKMTEGAGEDLKGLFITKARTKAVELLEQKSALEKVDDKYQNSLLVDYKDNKPIEPMLLPNWFIKMDSLAKDAIDHIKGEDVKFNQETWKEQILFWLENIRDWPISRQTVFGIRIPVWYEVKGNNLFVVFLDKDKNSHEGSLEELFKEYSLEEITTGLQKVIAPRDAKYIISKEQPKGEYIQETDTFDTWFSSSQWPLTATKYPDSDDFKNFFPTSFMDSMWDILFFWIARMIMMSLYLTKDMPSGSQVPFKNVYIHGRINDEKGQKMSKSKGNVIDPLDFIEKYGADALRMGIIVGGNTAAKMTSLSEGKVKGYRNFANKLWNMARFMFLMREDYGKEIPFYSEDLTDSLHEEDEKILNELNELIKAVNAGLDHFDFQNTGELVYQFIWHRIADEYIEHVKEREDKNVALSVLDKVFKDSLKLIHPYMPFVTEAIWKELPKQKEDGELIALSSWPKFS